MKSRALVSACTVALLLEPGSAPYAQSAFNDFSGGCPGAFARQKLIMKSMIGKWQAIGSVDILTDSIEHYISNSGNDTEKNCMECCTQSYNYQAVLFFKGFDSFGNISGNYVTSISDQASGPYQNYMSKHNKVYKIDCDGPDPGNSGDVAAQIEVLVHKDVPGLCDLSPMYLRYLDTDDSYRISMVTPTMFSRIPNAMDSKNPRIYHKQ